MSFSSCWRRSRTATTSACSTTRRTRSSPGTIRSSCCGPWPIAWSACTPATAIWPTARRFDELRQADGTLGYSPNLQHGVTGRGLNDYDAIFRILADHGYRGWVSIEDGMNGMEEMAESLAFLRRMGARYFPDRGG